MAATVSAGASVSVKGRVERGVNDARMTGFGLIFATGVGTGLSVGFASSNALLGIGSAIAAAVATAAVLAAISRIALVRRPVIALMHRITGQ